MHNITYKVLFISCGTEIDKKFQTNQLFKNLNISKGLRLTVRINI